MPLVINTNVASLNAQRQMVRSGSDLDQAMERLSSGKRVNTAADDAAGLAIANRMTSQIRGLDQAVRNANDGISLIQTAEGALDETTNILQRMRELAIQSANGIYSDADRATLDAEVQQLKTELNRIAETTTFNGQLLLDGSMKAMSLQVGALANQTVDLTLESFATSSLGGTAGDVVGNAATNGLADFDSAFATAGDIVINGVPMSAIDATTAPTNTVNGILAKLNSDLEGKGVEVATLVSLTAGSIGSGELRDGEKLSITVKDGNGLTQSFEITGTNNMKELVAKINADTSVEASLDNNGRLVFSQENVASITLAHTPAAAGAESKATGFEDGTYNFSVVLNDTSADKRGIKIELGAAAPAGAAAAMAGLGLNVNDATGALQGVAVTDFANMAEGDLIINGIAVGAVAPDTADAPGKAEALINAINKVSSQTGVVAYAGSAAGTIAMRSTNDEAISIKAGNAVDAADLLGHIGLVQQNATSGVGSVASVSIATAAGAQRAIDIVDRALEQVNGVRADLGAANNRLDFTISNLMNVSENTAASRSRIMDADFAAETANLSRAQVLQQASQAMLAQANARPQQVLQLLQG